MQNLNQEDAFGSDLANIFPILNLILTIINKKSENAVQNLKAICNKTNLFLTVYKKSLCAI